MEASIKEQMVHEELVVLLRVFFVVLAETWTHKPRELISREYVKGRPARGNPK